MSELNKVRKAVGAFPILLGSGIGADNIKEMFELANGAIVSTSLKSGKRITGEINVKKYNERIDVKKVKILMGKI